MRMESLMNKTSRKVIGLPYFFLIMCICVVNFSRPASAQETSGYDNLLSLFEKWREFESPPLLDGAPDYTAARFSQRYIEVQALQKRLNALEIDQWHVPQQYDWHPVCERMDG